MPLLSSLKELQLSNAFNAFCVRFSEKTYSSFRSTFKCSKHKKNENFVIKETRINDADREGF